MPVFCDSRAVFCCNRELIYPDGSKLLMVADRPIFRVPGWERALDAPLDVPFNGHLHDIDLLRRYMNGEAIADIIAEAVEGYEAIQKANSERSMRRARNAVRDYGLCNKFDYFVTLTLDENMINRYDIKEVTKKLNIWLNNQVKRKGLKYILVPELHKDGAIHFHGFFNDVLPMDDSGTMTKSGHIKPRRPRSAAERQRMIKDGWSIVYNLPAWPYGFTTAIPLYGERRAAVAYICKYIGKDAEKTGKIGGRWYYSGGGLDKPERAFGNAVAFCEVEKAPGTYVFDIPGLNAKVALLQIDGH
jgi:hypothetical protein